MSDDEDEPLPSAWGELPKPQLVVDNTLPPYRAFQKVAKATIRNFVVDCHGGEYVFAYQHVLSVLSNKPHYTTLTINLTSAIVTVFGRNLQPLAFVLRHHTCDTFSEYHRLYWQAPTDDSEPFIERIEVLMTREREPARPQEEAEEV